MGWKVLTARSPFLTKLSRLLASLSSLSFSAGLHDKIRQVPSVKIPNHKARRVFDYKVEIRDRVNKITEETKNKKLINALYWIREVAETAPDLLESILSRAPCS